MCLCVLLEVETHPLLLTLKFIFLLTAYVQVGTPVHINRHTAFIQGMFNSQLEAAKFEGGWLIITLNTNLLRHGYVLGMFISQNGRQV